jgi:predicted transcriptional regulator
MVAALKEWEPQIRNYREDWIHIIYIGDAELLWSKLFHIISRHSAVRSLYASKDLSWESLKEMYFDLTQDLYVKLQEKNRWQYYLDMQYTHERVEHELYDIEVPNLVSRLLRERHPESYRIARRTSNLLMTKAEFRCYTRPRLSLASLKPEAVKRPPGKMALKVYGLADWPADKPMQQQQHLHDMIKEVAYRLRDTRCAGRGSSSQVVISNVELTHLIIEIFHSINSPTDIRTMRSLVLSKLAIEDSQMLSMDETLDKANSETKPCRIEFTDNKPTPEEVVLEKEVVAQMKALADAILLNCMQDVRKKPQRFRKLIEVVWHCYFNPASPSQTTIAKLMDISDSLVSHYRRIFDTIARNEDLSVDECIALNGALEKRVSELIAKYQTNDQKQEKARIILVSADNPTYETTAYRLAAGAKA